MSIKNTCLCTIFIFSTFVYSQATIVNQKQLDSLNYELQRTIIQREKQSTVLDSMSYKIGVLQQNIKKLNKSEKPSFDILSLSTPVNLHIEPTISSQVLYKINIGDSLYLINEFIGNYIKASFNDVIGYILICKVEKLFTKSFKIGHMAHKSKIQKEIDDKDEQIRLKIVGDEYSSHYKTGRIAIGMSTNIVKIIMGPSNDIKRTVTADGIYEQWIYNLNNLFMKGHFELFFENNVLTSWVEN